MNETTTRTGPTIRRAMTQTAFALVVIRNAWREWWREGEWRSRR